jgi:hypothetical protein
VEAVMEPVIEREPPAMREMPTPEMPAAEVVHATAMTASEDR